MDPGWKNLAHKYETRAVFMRSKKWVAETDKQTRRRSVETNSTKSRMKTNISRAVARRKTY